MEELISPLSKDSLDLELIKTKLKDYLLQEDVITDVDYEGSNISILVSIISYVMLNINSTHALNVNQTTLKLSTIRQNIIQLAKSLNYNITKSNVEKLKIIAITIVEMKKNLNILQVTIIFLIVLIFSVKLNAQSEKIMQK
jgi:hypothetical protein